MAARKKTTHTQRSGSTREFSVLLEDIRSQFKVFGEGLQGLREQMQSSFEQVDRRFEQVDRRFEQIDRRFEQVDREIGLVKTAVLQNARELKEVRHDLKGLEQKVDRKVALGLFTFGCSSTSNSDSIPSVYGVVTYQASGSAEESFVVAGSLGHAKVFQFDTTNNSAPVTLSKSATKLIFKPTGTIASGLDLAFFAQDGTTRIQGIRCTQGVFDEGVTNFSAKAPADGGMYNLHLDGDGVHCSME